MYGSGVQGMHRFRYEGYVAGLVTSLAKLSHQIVKVLKVIGI